MNAGDLRSPTLLEAEKVQLVYEVANGEHVVAVNDLNLQMRKGEFICIVGASGCGKTTFLNAVAGFLTPSCGHISLNGRSISKPGPDRAMVFQQPWLLPWRTALRNVTYGLELSGNVSKSEAYDRANKLLEMVGLSGFAKLHPNQLSGGMQQRVNLARALAVQPEILLLDEPFASVDAQTREFLQVELIRICKSLNITALFVTHDVREAVILGDRVAVFSRRPGRIKEEIALQMDRPALPENEKDYARYIEQIESQTDFADSVTQVRMALRDESFVISGGDRDV